MSAVDRRRRQATERLLEQAEVVVEWFGRRDAGDLAVATRLPGWDVRTLGAHLLMMLRGATAVLGAPSPQRPTPLDVYLARYREDVGDIERRTLAVADTVTDLPTELAAAVTTLADRLAAEWPEVVTGWRGPLRSEDFVASRTLELVVHSDDLDAAARSNDLEPVAVRPGPLGAVTRTLAAVLETRFPGRTIEVRMPPDAAVQCGTADGAPSPAHTRGTPPNVVELAPLDFVRLATGRTRWADAVRGSLVRASGTRADLSEHLPLLS